MTKSYTFSAKEVAQALLVAVGLPDGNWDTTIEGDLEAETLTLHVRIGEKD